MTYKVEANIRAGTPDALLDDLIAAYDAVDEVCTCGADAEKVVAMVEAHMLSTVTRIILKYAEQVHVSEHLEAEEELQIT